MESFLIVSLVGILALVSAAFFLTMTEMRKLRKIIEKVARSNHAIVSVFHEVDDLLTSVKWHTEIILEKDTGPLNIAQQQLLNKVDTSVLKAMQLLKKNFIVTSRDYKTSRDYNKKKQIKDQKKEADVETTTS